MIEKKTFAVKASRDLYKAAYIAAVSNDQTIQAWVLDAIQTKLNWPPEKNSAQAA